MDGLKGSRSFKSPVDGKLDGISENLYHRHSTDQYASPGLNSYVSPQYPGLKAQYPDLARSSSWSLTSNPDVKRKRRLARYKAIAIEGKLKRSIRKSFQWMKGKYYDMMDGFS